MTVDKEAFDLWMSNNKISLEEIDTPACVVYRYTKANGGYAVDILPKNGTAHIYEIHD